MFKGVPPAPDRVFVQDLRRYDRKLDIEFDRATERFVILRKRAYGSPFKILFITREDGGFRQPDNRDLTVLALADLWRKNQEAKDRILDGERRMEDARAKQDANISEELRARSQENKIQLKNTWRKATNQGSKQPEFRRLDWRSKGLTMAEIRATRAAGQDPWTGKIK